MNLVDISVECLFEIVHSIEKLSLILSSSLVSDWLDSILLSEKEYAISSRGILSDSSL